LTHLITPTGEQNHSVFMIPFPTAPVLGRYTRELMPGPQHITVTVNVTVALWLTVKKP
jgi:hypothetical protein